MLEETSDKNQSKPNCKVKEMNSVAHKLSFLSHFLVFFSPAAVKTSCQEPS